MRPKGLYHPGSGRLAHIEIPTLCFLKEINEIGACRICVVEVKGARSLVASCVYPISEGMEIKTNSPKVLDSAGKPCSFCSPTMNANVFPACGAVTVSFSSWRKNWA